ncbi:MAG: nitroreductase family protein [Planctomycetota bacterium]|jgi:FMN reductase [NAD(P)H]
MENETIRLLRERSSCRNFLDKPIEPAVLRTVLEAGIQAPTGGNLQPYSIIKIEDGQTKERLADLCGNQRYVARAPTNLLFCIDMRRLERWAVLEAAPFTSRYSFRVFWIAMQDTVICAQNVCTAADALGLGSVYIGTILEAVPETRRILRLPRGVFPVVLLCLGSSSMRRCMGTWKMGICWKPSSGSTKSGRCP